MERAGDLLKDIFKDGLSAKGRRYSSFFKSWKKILGEKYAENISLVDIKKHTLLVTATHPGWMQLVSMKKHTLLKLLNKQYPELDIQNIKISLGGTDKKPPRPSSLIKKQKSTSEEEPDAKVDLKEELKILEDTELKKMLKKLYSSIRGRR